MQYKYYSKEFDNAYKQRELENWLDDKITLMAFENIMTKERKQ